MPEKRNRLAETALFVLFAVFNMYFIIVHVCWRDEANTWLMARDMSLGQLFAHTSYEGHPCLWYLAQMPFAKLGFPYITLKLLAFVFVAAALAMVLFLTRLPLWMKTVIAMSPMCIAAFITPARNYCLCALLITAAAVLYGKRRQRPLLYGAALALLLQTHVVMGGMVVICGFLFGMEVLIGMIRKDKEGAALWKQTAGVMLPVLSGFFLLWEFRDTGHALGTVGLDPVSGNKAVRFAMEFWKGMVCLVGRYCALPVIALSCALILFFCMKSRKAWAPSLILISSVGWQVGMGAYIYELSYQYITWTYIFLWYLLVCFELLPDLSFKALRMEKSPDRRLLLALFSFLVFVGMWGAMGRESRQHVKRPFSASKAVAAETDKLPEDAVIFENVEDHCCAVVPYLKEKTMYNPFSKAEASYFNRNPDHLQQLSLREFKDICRQMKPEAEGVYIVWSVNWSDLDCYIDVTPAELRQMELIWSSIEEFGGESISGEDFEIRYLSLR